MSSKSHRTLCFNVFFIIINWAHFIVTPRNQNFSNLPHKKLCALKVNHSMIPIVLHQTLNASIMSLDPYFSSGLIVLICICVIELYKRWRWICEMNWPILRPVTCLSYLCLSKSLSKVVHKCKSSHNLAELWPSKIHR